MLIRDIPEDDRPREKLVNKGAEALTDSEILALFFGTGRKGISAIELGKEMIQQFGSLRNMSRAGFEELLKVDGVGPAKAAQLAAIFEFGKRLAREPFHDQAITSPEDVYELIGAEMQRLSQESVRAILLNSQKKLIQISEVFVGTTNQSFANPPEILRRVISHCAPSFILVHNHPSGDPSPSKADHEVTRRMKGASDAIGVEFIDHIIIGGYSVNENRSPYFSFREAGLL